VVVRAFKLTGGCAGGGISQSWDVTHGSIYGQPGVADMQGFVRTIDDDSPMAYWEEDTLPFYYSLANTFTLANRWFCSAPCHLLHRPGSHPAGELTGLGRGHRGRGADSGTSARGNKR
jgi:hypothetical protein